jgi:hypothetical protein
MNPEVTIINDKYILYNGSKFRRLKNKTIKKLDEKEKVKRATYMKAYRKKLAWRMKYMENYMQERNLQLDACNLPETSLVTTSCGSSL